MDITNIFLSDFQWNFKIAVENQMAIYIENKWAGKGAIKRIEAPMNYRFKIINCKLSRR